MMEFDRLKVKDLKLLAIRMFRTLPNHSNDRLSEVVNELTRRDGEH